MENMIRTGNAANETTAAPITSKPQGRLFYLDNLRALALLAGIFFHVGIGFSVITQEVWPTSNPTTSIWFDYWVWFLHTFRMPLFFLIAGFFAHLLIEKRGIRGFVKNRVMRITLPFIIFWPILTAAILGVIYYGAVVLQVETPIMIFFKSIMENPEAAQGQQPPISTTHLWFIYYLTFFCLATALLTRFLPLGNLLQRFVSKPLVLFGVLPLICFAALSQKTIPHPAPESFIPELWALVFYGSFFAAGMGFYKNTTAFATIQKQILPLIAVTILSAGLFFIYLPKETIALADAMATFMAPQKLTATQLVLSATTALLAWLMTYISLVFSQKFLNKENAVLKYLSDGSYWAYIIHVPIVFYLQCVFYSIDMPLFSEFLVISALTIGLSYLSYFLLIKPTPIGWLLNGRKKKMVTA